MEPPPGYEVPEGYVLRLLKALYGLKQAGRQWYRKLRSVMQEFGLKQIVNDPNTSSTALNGFKAVIVEGVADEEEPSPKKRKKVPALAKFTVVEIDDPPPLSQSNPLLRPSEVIKLGDPPHLQTAGLNGASSSALMISPTTSGRMFFGLKLSAPKEPSKL
jgi:hypothetical protein